MAVYNVYCDESCHLQHDHLGVFVLGATWVDHEHSQETFAQIRAIKKEHGLSQTFEAKWTKISASKVNFYKALVEYFFSNQNLHFRAVVVPDKTLLDHSAFSQDHNTWYYKMFYQLLRVIMQPSEKYNLYFDIKDTKGDKKVKELKRILNIASIEDLSTLRAQQVRSHEVELMQITDLFCGALAYAHRGLKTSTGKREVVELIESNIGKSVLASTDREEDKFNVFVWKPQTNKI